MQTLLQLDEQLIAEAERIAAQSGKTLSDVVEEALRERLARHQYRPKVELPTFRGDGMLPGIDFSNNAALLDLMDAEDDTASRK